MAGTMRALQLMKIPNGNKKDNKNSQINSEALIAWKVTVCNVRVTGLMYVCMRTVNV